MADSVVAQEVYKIFGAPKARREALALLKDGQPVDSVREATGCTAAAVNVSFTVASGEFFVLMGLSGSGKSTMLRCINGIIPISEGRISIDGTPMTGLKPDELRRVRREKTSMVFQGFALLPHRNVLDNVAFGLELKGVPRSVRLNAAEKALEQVGLGAWGHSLPRELSGGMQQRVGLARALVTESPILLMDEPFSALDPLIRREMQDELLHLRDTMNRTIIFVTHDLNEAIKLGDRIAIMHQGQLAQVGTAEEILSHPADDYVRRFVEDIDRSRALTAGTISRKVETVSIQSGPRVALRMMRSMGLSSCYVVDRNGRLHGLVSVESALQAADHNDPDLKQATRVEIATVLQDASLVEVSRIFAERGAPIAVTDENQKFIGIVTRVDVLAAIGGVWTAEEDAPDGGGTS